ncbi:hypothetical protein VB776_15875 [Arcicella sp. DC2W]|uniref:Uncharacterized protein n=1 Tax=Arcicella gelida TaxID=2984195 RepID=A0ABU5S7F7_9BACT|nr:hypothetical protein [Arcicella sp. DC2W]MEA5404412.1 hypothetical protein [Arcicella sp. DC2W]
MTNKTLFKKKCRKYFSFFEEVEGFEALVHENGIIYTKIKEEVLTTAFLFFDTYHSPFKISSLWFEKKIPLIEKIVQEIVEKKHDMEQHTIRTHFVSSTKSSPFLALPKEMLNVANEVIVQQESDIEAAATIIKEYFYSKEIQEFLSLTIEDLNQQLLECEDLNTYYANIFCPDGNGYLRTYIVAKYFNNQRVFDWFNSLILPWLKNNEDEYWHKKNDQIEKVNQLFNSKK